MHADPAPESPQSGHLVSLQHQLRLLAATMTVAPESAEVVIMLTGVAQTADRAADDLAGCAPEVIILVRQAVGSAAEGRHELACTDLIAAHGRLAAVRRDRVRVPGHSARGRSPAQEGDPVRITQPESDRTTWSYQW
ncbi:hypothetical protein [Amycolatopsis sp. NBC_01480]|uniref:hypothetical protein n=1 Tax=Amycolatopsis sp. NBC_01480 TaxID=2903562 RepID=UPI002E2DC2BE|nr:hypothetical protein [Amycolatopsis sp. NBC_01480]